MNQEIQRIKDQLTTLLQSLLENQLPIILSTYYPIQGATLNSQPAEMLSANSIQIPSKFIKSLNQILLKNLIEPIVQNIGNIKQEINRHKIQNEQLKAWIKKDSVESEIVKQSIKQLINQKDQLQHQLSQLKNRQNSLAKMINSNCLQAKIKDMIQENQSMKQQVKQRDQLIQVKLLQIKEYIEKQAFWTSQIRALQNDNVLFHKDLIMAHSQNKILSQKINQLNKNIKLIQQSLQKAKMVYNKQLDTLQAELRKQKQSNKQIQKDLYQKQEKCIDFNKQIQRQRKINQDLKEEANYLRAQLQKLKQQIEGLMVQRRTAQQLENKFFKQIEINQQKLRNLEAELKIKQKQYFQQKINITEQIKQLQNQLRQQKQKASFVQNELKNLKQSKAKQFIYLENKHNQQIDSQAKEYQKITLKLTQQIGQYKNELETYSHQLQLQKANSQHYRQYLEENNQLKAQLQRITLMNYQTKNVKSIIKKYTFKFMQLRQEILRLKKQSLSLRNALCLIFQQNKKRVIKQINKFVIQMLSKKSEYQSCQDWQHYQTNKKIIYEQKNKNQFIDLRSNKDLKNLNEKYKLLKQQNLKFGNRIQQIIHD